MFCDGVGDDLAGEREEQAGSLDQQERLQRLFREVAEAEQAGVAQVDQEVDAVVRPGGDLDLEHDFMDVFGDAGRRRC